MPTDLEHRIVAATPTSSAEPDFDRLVDRGLRQRRLRRVLAAAAVLVAVVGAGAVATALNTGTPSGPAILDGPSVSEPSHAERTEDGFGLRDSSGLSAEHRRTWQSEVPTPGHGSLYVEEFGVAGTAQEAAGWTAPSVMWMRADDPTGLPTTETIRRDLDRVDGEYQTRRLETHHGTWDAIYVPLTDSTTATLELDDGGIVKVTAAQVGFDEIIDILQAIQLPVGREGVGPNR